MDNVHVQTYGNTDIRATNGYNPSVNMVCATITCIQKQTNSSGTRNIKTDVFGNINATAIKN